MILGYPPDYRLLLGLLSKWMNSRAMVSPVVVQLIVGYARGITDEESEATGSVTLVRVGDHCLLVDCGDPWNGAAIATGAQSHPHITE
jgi:hypothetical protein